MSAAGTPSQAETVEWTGAQATLAAIEDAMASDPNVLLFGEDVADREGGGVAKASAGLSTRFGARVRSTPIAEQAIVGLAIGAAMAGKRPIAEIMIMNFMPVAMDQIFNHAAKLRFMSGGRTSLPLTIRMMGGVGGGIGGQHSDMLEVWLAHTPGLKVVVPSTPADQYGLLLSCIFDNNPCIFIETMLLMRVKGAPAVRGTRVPLGKAKLVREGSDVTLISYGRPMHDVNNVAAKLHSEGISCEVIDLRTIVPLDEEALLKSVAKTRRAVIVHEAVTSFGVGAEIAARLHRALFNKLAAPVERVGARYSPVPFSKPLEAAYMWSPQRIEEAIRKTLSK